MNTFNNKRKKESVLKIEKSFIELLQTMEVNEISISDICKNAQINRSTFYANYLDIFDLIDNIRIKIVDEFLNVYEEECLNRKHSYNFLKLFKHIKENQIFYKTYFKLQFDLTEPYFYNIDDEEILKFFNTTNNKDYHIEFFKAGLSAIIKKWLNNGCIETPEEINEIIKEEYKNRVIK